MKSSTIGLNAYGPINMRDEREPLGVTPGDDTSGLILTNLRSREDRNAVELESISRAYDKHIHKVRRKKPGSDWFTSQYLCEVHQDMLGAIWDWAGKYRTTELNLGVQPHLIREQVAVLCGDFRYWDSNACSLPVLEIAARLQHRIAWIHPFKNGNGRLARMMTDVFLHSRAHPLPDWPQIQLMSHGNDVREQYIAAMEKADQEGDFAELIRFIEGCPADRG